MKPFLIQTMLALAVAWSPVALARNMPGEISGADLPKEARATLSLIRNSGPFPYPKDGVTFSNREKILPGKPRGFYREYTVKTPGERSRGARRVVCGGNREGAATHSPAPCYYTSDHYASFARIKDQP